MHYIHRGTWALLAAVKLQPTFLDIITRSLICCFDVLPGKHAHAEKHVRMILIFGFLDAPAAA